MSSFRDIDFRLTYQSGTKASDVMQEFYIPVLGLTKNYDRVAGYFSSATFANSARGVAGLVRNGGRMRMVTSHAFTFSDGCASGLLQLSRACRKPDIKLQRKLP